MSVYIEPLVAQDLILTYVTGATAYRLLRLKSQPWRLIAAAMLSSAFSLFRPFLPIGKATEIILKFALGIILTVILFYGKLNLFYAGIAFFGCYFLYGGCVFALGFAKYGNASDAMREPLIKNAWITVLAALTLYTLIKGASVVYHRTRDLNKRVYKYAFTVSGKEVSGNGFMDTGNRLYDSVSGLPVVVIGLKTLLPLLSDSELTELLTGHVDKVFEGARKFTCKSVGGDAQMWLIEPEKFQVYYGSDKNILYDVMVGLSLNGISGGKNYDAILHPALAEVI